MATIIRAIRPQEGPQTAFLTTPADIAVLGGGAGGGKSYSLLMEPMRHIRNPRFGGVIFRRLSPQITSEGGLWDTAGEIYPGLGGAAKVGELQYRWDSGRVAGGKITFRHLQHEATKYAWQGSQIPYLGFDELTHFCYNAVMETLTESGWKRIADVRPGERVLALTPDGVARFEDVTAAWDYDYEGPMHETTNRSIRYSVTPNHKMVIRRQGYEGWQFREAKGLDRFPRFPFDSEWEGPEREWLDLPKPSGRGIGANQNSVPRIAADLYLEFLGWYLAEGSSFLASKKRNASPCVSIRQTKACPELHDLMKRFPLRSSFVEGDGYRVFSKQLHDHFKPMGNLYEKRVPRWVMSLCRRQLRIVFDSFTLGDGQKITNGAIAFGLANEGLIDDIQEIAAKLGRRSTKAAGKGGKGNAYTTHRLYVHARSGGLVHDRPGNKRIVHYKGKVHCLTVEPSHTLLVRHEGRVSWSGNSESQFFYMLSRNRSTCGVRPYVRATTNPDAGSWVKRFLGPWVDRKHPLYPTPSGAILWMIRHKGQIVYRRTREEIARDFGAEKRPKSVTYIRSMIWDNPELLGKDPDYLANLEALPPVERARLLEGDWDVCNEGLVYPDFGTIVVEPEEWAVAAPAMGKNLGGIDWGFRDPFAALWAKEDVDGTLWVGGEHYKDRETPTVLSKALPRDEGDPYRWWADPAGASQIAEFRLAGHDVIPCVHLGREPIKSGVAVVTQRIRDRSIRVLGTLGNLIDEAGKYRYGEQGDSETPVDKDNHAMDALRYLIVGRDRFGVVKDRTPPPSEESLARSEAAIEAATKKAEDEYRDIEQDHWWGG